MRRVHRAALASGLMLNLELCSSMQYCQFGVVSLSCWKVLISEGR